MTMSASLTSMRKDERFHIPGQPNLKHGVRAYHGGATRTLTDAQVIALTLNEICALRGQGLLYWFPSSMNNTNRVSNMIYLAKQWTETEKTEYWKKTQRQRLSYCDSKTVPHHLCQAPTLNPLSFSKVAEITEGPPNPMCSGITVKIFATPSENDTVSWQEDINGRTILCYRAGRIYLGWFEDWQPHATCTAQSSFARTQSTEPDASYTPTPSYSIKWRDLPPDVLARAAVPGNCNEGVKRGLDDIWHLRPRFTFNAVGQPSLEYF